jgi:predicted small lipoprotein YifL
MKRTLLVLAAALSLTALAGCETATPYQPMAQGNAQYGGFTDTKVDANHWRVTFQGNSLTARDTVENYLLYRAAELTLAQGYDWFETTDHATDKQTNTYFDPGPWGYGYGWRPYWRFYGGGYWHRGPWGDPWDDPFWGPGRFGGPWGPGDIETTERYEASAELVMNHGPKPANDRRALDAREVIANLGPKIVRPK